MKKSFRKHLEMQKSWQDLTFYLIAITVIVACVVIIYIIPMNDIVRNLFSLPAITSFFVIIIEAWNRQKAHERSKELQEKEHTYSLGIASHMAIYAFDKQMEFCEKYFTEARNSLFNLTKGSDYLENALSDAQKLSGQRLEYGPWISGKIEKGLLPFEASIREIGALSITAKPFEVGPQRTLLIEKLYEKLQIHLIVKSQALDQEGNVDDETIYAVINHLREVTGVSSLTELRDKAIQSAHHNVTK